MLAVFPKQALLDGVPVDAASLATILENKRVLYDMLGGNLKDQIVVQVATGVSERQVRPFLASARSAGFVNVTRLPPTPH
jgi:hypothetical protein